MSSDTSGYSFYAPQEPLYNQFDYADKPLNTAYGYGPKMLQILYDSINHSKTIPLQQFLDVMDVVEAEYAAAEFKTLEAFMSYADKPWKGIVALNMH